MTTIDPQYQARAAQVTAARVAEEAARRVRRRMTWGYGARVDELIASTDPRYDMPATHSARDLVSGVELIARTQNNFAPDGPGRLGYRRSPSNIVPLPLRVTKFLVTEFPDIADTLREAEADLVD